MMLRLHPRLLLVSILLGAFCAGCAAPPPEPDVPRIVNIVNFIRLTEPRYEEVTDDILFETVVRQIEAMDRHGFPGTFLLQYDALTDPRYPALLKAAAANGHETGGWWEITQPHVEKAGIAWRGRYPWDWHADVGFSTGYTVEEREKLVDVYMEDYKVIFGEYPKVVGSWFIDAHTLLYMHDRYGVETSCNVKDQVGTDGYTVWGGYWSGAYYPSRRNAYMPAQHEAMQIPVPVFRMLGSDPIYQYDNGLGSGVQKVESLEPVYPESGGHPGWIRYFFKSHSQAPALGFTYAQTGQENSFTWSVMQRGLEEQFRVLDSLRNIRAVRIEPLSATGRWFRQQYPSTPPTATSALEDFRDEGRQTVWYDSRFYRANLLLEGGRLRFRDIHLFDEMLSSRYLGQPGTSNQCVYETLPVVDGFRWSTSDRRAGLWFCRLDEGGRPVPVSGIGEISPRGSEGEFTVEWSAGKERYAIRLSEKGLQVLSQDKSAEWCLAFLLPEEKAAELPAGVVLADRLEFNLDGFPYTVNVRRGETAAGISPPGNGYVCPYIIRPVDGIIGLGFAL